MAHALFPTAPPHLSSIRGRKRHAMNESLGYEQIPSRGNRTKIQHRQTIIKDFPYPVYVSELSPCFQTLIKHYTLPKNPFDTSTTNAHPFPPLWAPFPLFFFFFSIPPSLKPTAPSSNPNDSHTSSPRLPTIHPSIHPASPLSSLPSPRFPTIHPASTLPYKHITKTTSPQPPPPDTDKKKKFLPSSLVNQEINQPVNSNF